MLSGPLSAFVLSSYQGMGAELQFRIHEYHSLTLFYHAIYQNFEFLAHGYFCCTFCSRVFELRQIVHNSLQMTPFTSAPKALEHLRFGVVIGRRST